MNRLLVSLVESSLYRSYGNRFGDGWGSDSYTGDGAGDQGNRHGGGESVAEDMTEVPSADRHHALPWDPDAPGDGYGAGFHGLECGNGGING